MAALDSINPFDELGSDLATAAPQPPAERAAAVPPAASPVPTDAAAPPPAPDEVNPFEALGEGVVPRESVAGSLARKFAASAIPVFASLYPAAQGATLSAGLGTSGGPFDPITVPAGGLIGGIIGAMGGSYAVKKAQDWALSKAPDSWVDALGQSQSQQQADDAQHPYASFIGGLAPYALTMRPGGFTSGAALPAEATAYQRLMANPVTQRLFGGAAMGGMELGQEKAEGQKLDWQKALISTGFGAVFNKPTRFGELLHGGPGAVPTVVQVADS